AGDTTITGTGLSGATVEVFVDARSAGTTSVNANGTWALPVPPLSAGQVITATQTVAGFVSPLSPPVVVGAAVLRRIDITPAPAATIARGQTLAFAARGTFSDSSVVSPLPSVTWSSDNQVVATIGAS